MRVVYGAGAVAVVSVIAVGMIQPDYTATEVPLDDSAAGAAALKDGAAGIGLGAAPADLLSGQSAQAQPTPRVKIRHRVRYVYLRPGETAPPGATVVTANGSTASANRPRSNRTSRPNGTNTAQRPRQTSNTSRQPAANPRPAATQRPPAATPRPTPRPTTTTRQSGR